MIREYCFYIIDREIDSEYYFEGYFVNAAEALAFIRDNRKAGNILTLWAIDFLDPKDFNLDLARYD